MKNKHEHKHVFVARVNVRKERVCEAVLGAYMTCAFIEILM